MVKNVTGGSKTKGKARKFISSTSSNKKQKYVPTIPNYNVLNTKEKILHVTGPDAFTDAVND
jgi:hypothetical protein